MLNEVVEKKNDYILENVDWEDVFLLSEENHNEWPSKTLEFRETIKYRRELKKLAEKVIEIMDENLGLPKGYIKKAFNGGEEENAFFGTKVSHYPPCPHPEKVNGLRAHTDAGGVILLFQDDKVGGLQILKDGQWIDVQPLPNSIIINTGDQIEVLGSIFDTAADSPRSEPHTPKPTGNHHKRDSSSFFTVDGETISSEELEHLENGQFDDLDGDRNHKRRRALFRRVGDLLMRKSFHWKEPSVDL